VEPFYRLSLTFPFNLTGQPRGDRDRADVAV